MFYKIVDNKIIKAPSPLIIGDQYVITRNEQIHNEQGYYKILELPYPDDNKQYEPIYYMQDNKIIRDWKQIELPPIPYEDRVVNRIRERYNINQELAILRQRDVKFDEWMEYNNYVEQIKTEEKAREELINNG